MNQDTDDNRQASQPPAADAGSRGRARPGLRWWPAAAILALALGRITQTWVMESLNRQDQVVNTIFTVILAFLGLLLWWLLLSRLAWRIRLIGAGMVIALTVLSTQVIRIRAVSGDLVPKLSWRWSATSDARLPPTIPDGRALPGQAAPTGDPPPGAQDYPQFLGPNRDGVVRGIRLATDWSTSPPVELWRHPVGAGWSGFAVAGSYAITQEQRGGSEQVVAYDLLSGRTIWSQADPNRFESVLAGDGPRATPTIDRGRVYTLGSTGILNCLDLRSGERLWARDILVDAGAEVPVYGSASSPLIVGDMVVVSAGGTDGRSLLAYHRATGELVWGGGNNPAGYSSPILTVLAGLPQILIFNNAALVAHAPENGRVLWAQPWPAGTEKVSQPVPLPGDRVFLSSGYGIGGKLFRIDAHGGVLRVTTLWETPRLKAKFTNVVHRDGTLFGLDDGVLVALDLENGERRWKGGRYGHGQVILAGDVLLVQGEDGEVILVAADPEQHRELGRLEALHGKTWNHPALAGPYLLVRHAEEAACYRLPVE